MSTNSNIHNGKDKRKCFRVETGNSFPHRNPYITPTFNGDKNRVERCFCIVIKQEIPSPRHPPTPHLPGPSQATMVSVDAVSVDVKPNVSPPSPSLPLPPPMPPEMTIE